MPTINPWLIVGVILVWLASLAGVGYWQRSDGQTVERSAWEIRENVELRTANQKIVELNDRERAREQLHAQDISEITTVYQKELKRESDQAKTDRSAVHAGTLRLFDRAAPGIGACGSGLRQTFPSASGRDGGTGAELSGAAAEFLLDIVNECDAVARQLGAGQQVIRSDRK